MQAALLGGHFDVPVIFISSDDAGCAEAKQLLGQHIVAVSVKTGYWREGGKLKAPAKCRELIRAGLKEAIALVGRAETTPFKLWFSSPKQSTDSSQNRPRYSRDFNGYDP